jgi:hypothetical protein
MDLPQATISVAVMGSSSRIGLPAPITEIAMFKTGEIILERMKQLRIFTGQGA